MRAIEELHQKISVIGGRQITVKFADKPRNSGASSHRNMQPPPQQHQGNYNGSVGGMLPFGSGMGSGGGVVDSRGGVSGGGGVGSYRQRGYGGRGGGPYFHHLAGLPHYQPHEMIPGSHLSPQLMHHSTMARGYDHGGYPHGGASPINFGGPLGHASSPPLPHQFGGGSSHSPPLPGTFVGGPMGMNPYGYMNMGFESLQRNEPPR